MIFNHRGSTPQNLMLENNVSFFNLITITK